MTNIMFWVLTHFLHSCHLICEIQALMSSYRTSLYCRLTLLSSQSCQSCRLSVWMCRATAYHRCLCATVISDTSKASFLTTTPSKCPPPRSAPKESSTSLNISTWRPVKGLRTSLRKLCGPPPSTAGEGSSRTRGLRVLNSLNCLYQWKLYSYFSLCVWSLQSGSGPVPRSVWWPGFRL